MDKPIVSLTLRQGDLLIFAEVPQDLVRLMGKIQAESDEDWTNRDAELLNLAARRSGQIVHEKRNIGRL